MSAQLNRPKVIELEAILFEDEHDGSFIAGWTGGSNELRPDQVQIPTATGVLTARKGDWVVRAPSGEFRVLTESARLPTFTTPRGKTIPRDRSKDMVLRQIGWVGHRNGTVYALDDDPLGNGREGGGVSPLYETTGLWEDLGDGKYGIKG